MIKTDGKPTIAWAKPKRKGLPRSEAARAELAARTKRDSLKTLS